VKQQQQQQSQQYIQVKVRFFVLTKKKNPHIKGVRDEVKEQRVVRLFDGSE